jgi:hypothetical protein
LGQNLQSIMRNGGVVVYTPMIMQFGLKILRLNERIGLPRYPLQINKIAADLLENLLIN